MQHRYEDSRVSGETPEVGRKIFTGSVAPIAHDAHRASPTQVEDRTGQGTVGSSPASTTRNSGRGNTAWDLAKDVLLSLSTFVGPLAAFLDEAVSTIARALDVPHAEILELTPDGFARRARVGIGHAPPAEFLAPDAGGSHAGYALSSGRTLSVRNYGLESRFDVPVYLREAGINAGVTVPIRLPNGDPWGVVAVHDRPNRSFSTDARAFTEEVARVVGVTGARERESARRCANRCADVDRKLEEERRSRRSSEWRLGYFAEAEQVAAMATTTAEAARTTVKHAVPELADWCYLDLLQENGTGTQTLTRLFVEHADDRTGSDEIAEEFRRRYPVDYNAPLGTPKVLRTGEPDRIPQLDDEHRRQIARDPASLRLLRRVNAGSFMCVPLEAGHRRIGAMGFYSTTSGRDFQPEHVQMACGLARILSLRLADRPIADLEPETSETPVPSCSPRPTWAEQRILDRLAAGMKPRDVAQDLGVALKTIRNHIHNLNTKFRTRDYKETAAEALRLGIAYPDSYA